MIWQLAVLAQALPTAAREFRILPAGVFRSRDGRPQGLPGWKIDAEIARRVIAKSSPGDVDLVIDYEHQTLNAKDNGQPAPAAGWFKRMEWREGLGLFAVDVNWTDKAKAMIAAGEYRHVSPVFPFSTVTGEVLQINGVGLTNFPALPGLTDLAHLSSQRTGLYSPRESDRGIESFNRAFEGTGIMHPDSSPETIAAMCGQISKASFPEGLAQSDPRGAEALRSLCPEAWSN